MHVQHLLLSGTGPDLSGGDVCLSSAQSTVQAWVQARLEARIEGKDGGGLQQPLPFVLVPYTGPRATVASRDLWTQGQKRRSLGEGDEAEKINQVDRGIHPPPWDHEHRACPGGNWLSQPRGEAQGRMVQEGAGSRSSTNTGIESQPPGVTQSSLGLWLQTCCVALASHAPFWASAFSFIKGNFDDENTVSFKELSMGSDAIMLTKM